MQTGKRAEKGETGSEGSTLCICVCCSVDLVARKSYAPVLSVRLSSLVSQLAVRSGHPSEATA